MDKPTIKSLAIGYDNFITIAASEGAVIHYTLDGSVPSEESPVFTENIPYPVRNTVIKAIAVKDNSLSDISEYTCRIAIGLGYMNQWRDAGVLLVSEPLDFMNREGETLPSLFFIGNGKLMNSKGFWINGTIYPLGLDYDKYFENCGDYKKYGKWAIGQILTKDNKIIRFDGRNWHTLQEINSGTFNNKALSPDEGFAYFCTDRKTAEGNSNGIMIYHKGDNIWVDALGRIIQ